jgi:hypothetical protein
MTKDKALDLAKEALENSLPRLAPYGEQDWLDSKAAITAIKQARSAPAQEPVAFLANGTRFKISYDSRQSGGQIHNIPQELGGRWVAFVAAEDDCHLKLTTPPNVATPLAAQRQSARSAWVGLTDEEIMDMYNEPRSDAEMIAFGREVEAKLKELNT